MGCSKPEDSSASGSTANVPAHVPWKLDLQRTKPRTNNKILSPNKNNGKKKKKKATIN